MTDRRPPGSDGESPGRSPLSSTSPPEASEETASSGGADPTPIWATGADVLSDAPEGQVLVVGDGVVGSAVTAVLRRAGYDPLLVSVDGSRSRSRVTTVDAAALHVLDALGVADQLRRDGVAVDSVPVRSGRFESDPPETDPPNTDPPDPDSPDVATREPDPRGPSVVVRTTDLRRTLRECVPDRQYRPDRRVASLSPDGDALVVEFDGGVREWFDAVVDAGAGASPPWSSPGDATAAHTLAQYEAVVDTDPPSVPHDRWYPGALLQRLPRPGEPGHLLRVTTPDSAADRGAPTGNGTRGDRSESVDGDPSVPVGGGLSDSEGGGLPDALDDELAGAAPVAVRQVEFRARDPEDRWWGEGRVARCGGAAVPVAPATGLRATLGLGDAAALAAALSVAGRSVPAAVETYAGRRRRRFRALRRAAGGAGGERDGAGPDAPEGLAAVSLFRDVVRESL